MADTYPVSGLDDLDAHLDHLLGAPEEALDRKLFDDVELQLTEYNIPPLIPRFLPRLTTILSQYQHDPKQLVSITIKLLGPVSFTDVLKLATEESLIRALQSPAPSANLLALDILRKAAKHPSETGILSNMKPTVVQLLRTWLSCPNVDVGEEAIRTLGDLLETDSEVRNLNSRMNDMEIARSKPVGQGLLWRRIFHDEDVYALLFDLLSHKTTDHGHERLDERQKSLAQGRMLRLLPRLATLDFASIAHSEFPQVEATYGLNDKQVGLLYFAAMDMINKDDVLMHLTLMDFFAVLLETLSATDISQQSIQYLGWLLQQATSTDRSLHQSLLSLALSPNSSPELVDLMKRLRLYRPAT